MKVPAVLKNKYLFYALAVLAALNVIGYASVKAYECLALFVLAGYGMHCYCKNKSLAILAALFVANFVFGCGRVKEGFEEAMKAPEDLLKDAAEAAEKAGGMLDREGKEGMADVCAQVSGAALDTANECESKKKQVDGEEKDACDYTEAVGSCNDSDMKTKTACSGQYDVNGQMVDRKWTQTSAATCVAKSN